MAGPEQNKNQKGTITDTTVSIDDADPEEDLLYTYKQKNDNSQMRWNNNLCRKPRK
jgi:hypothetical protein